MILNNKHLRLPVKNIKKRRASIDGLLTIIRNRIIFVIEINVAFFKNWKIRLKNKYSVSDSSAYENLIYDKISVSVQ